MHRTFVKADFSATAFRATRILFDNSDLVSMEVECRVEGHMQGTTFLFSFSRFNDLLRFSGESGERLQLRVSDKLVSDEQQPYLIDLKEEPIVFTTCRLDLNYLIEADRSCFSVDDVMPLSLVQQARNLRINTSDFGGVNLQSDTTLNAALREMATLYRYYLGLRELNLSEEHAREKAGLRNDKLFRIAYHAAKDVLKQAW